MLNNGEMPNNEPLTKGLSVGGDKSAKVKHLTINRLCYMDDLKNHQSRNY
jgi:hypothetical protein